MYTKEEKINQLVKLFNAMQELSAMMEEDQSLNNMIGSHVIQNTFSLFPLSMDEMAYEVSELIIKAKKELK
ncbi:hypothetical protein PUS82_00540 [Cytobacillus firmus]|uniref:hypothetical protein n=1 Tax=Cytobacillus firmus TaxID=1399 RepID=UPI00237A762C|nr:hypothetical protein [Cytobacillus firmus]MDD9309819.1 hypothetical protein [Cytobacillus firmus]